MEERKSSLSLEDRKKLTLSGVLEVVNFDDEKISLNTILGNLAIKGEGLKMNKLDVQNGDVIIIGYISSMIYSGKDGKKSKESIIKKIFK
ncbi:MAG: sporulation protein YabP [Clostridium sp.]|uniref:sporulation protein YabP n=1 Tax=Clostridium sp. TaxID=1506 RepID=UPI001E0C8093|nr:sporulation protein YabP [Clostridium sp.]MBS5928129.1 sporulation protein YabP [Clostridium sp.]MBS5987248.1 sporulation protein YabP [Clostridium sp.]